MSRLVLPSCYGFGGVGVAGGGVVGGGGVGVPTEMTWNVPKVSKAGPPPPRFKPPGPGEPPKFSAEPLTMLTT